MTELQNHPGVRSSLDLLSAWLEAQLAYGGAPGVAPGLSIGIVHDQLISRSYAHHSRGPSSV